MKIRQISFCGSITFCNIKESWTTTWWQNVTLFTWNKHDSLNLVIERSLAKCAGELFFKLPHKKMPTLAHHYFWQITRQKTEYLQSYLMIRSNSRLNWYWKIGPAEALEHNKCGLWGMRMGNMANGNLGECTAMASVIHRLPVTTLIQFRRHFTRVFARLSVVDRHYKIMCALIYF